MSSVADRLGEVLEKVIDDRRARIAGSVVGGLVLLIAVGFLMASKAEYRKSAAALAAHLPAQALSIPIMRSLPEPQPRKGQVVERLAAPVKAAKGRYVTARR
ncbi:MAG: hypothetical protein IT380_10455 [Myxococcales bacterium]|nr:hypothetical protein [Myxococcales bacterium]